MNYTLVTSTCQDYELYSSYTSTCQDYELYSSYKYSSR